LICVQYVHERRKIGKAVHADYITRLSCRNRWDIGLRDAE